MAPIASTRKTNSKFSSNSKVPKNKDSPKSTKPIQNDGRKRAVISSKGNKKKSSSDELGDQIQLMEAELAALAADMKQKKELNNSDSESKSESESNSSSSDEEYKDSGSESSKSGGRKSYIVIARDKFETSSGEQTSTDESGSSWYSESEGGDGSKSESEGIEGSGSEAEHEDENEDEDDDEGEGAIKAGNMSNEEPYSDEEGNLDKDVKDDEESIKTNSEDAYEQGDATEILELFDAAREGRNQDAMRILEAEPDLIGCMTSGPSETELDRLRAMIPQNGDIPLHFAARAGQIGTVKELVRFIKDHSKPYSQVTLKLLGNANCDGDTPLHVALKNRQVEVAFYLVAERPEVAYQVNKVGVSPLFLAIEGRYMDLVNDIFLRCPGKFVSDSRKEGLQKAKKALLAHAAIFARNLDILKQILHNLPELNGSQDIRGWQPLSLAAYEGFLDAVRYILMEFPDSVKTRDRDGLFPIHKAVGGGHISVIKEIISHYNEAKYQVGEKGQTMVDIALSEDRLRVFTYLKTLPDFEKIINLKVGNSKVRGKAKKHLR